jgi:hypothetical protein
LHELLCATLPRKKKATQQDIDQLDARMVRGRYFEKGIESANVDMSLAKKLANARSSARLSGDSSGAFGEAGLAFQQIGDIKSLAPQSEEKAASDESDGQEGEESESQENDEASDDWFEREEVVGGEIRKYNEWIDTFTINAKEARRTLAQTIKLVPADKYNASKVDVEIGRKRLNTLRLILQEVPKASVDDSVSEGAAGTARLTPESLNSSAARDGAAGLEVPHPASPSCPFARAGATDGATVPEREPGPNSARSKSACAPKAAAVATEEPERAPMSPILVSGAGGAAGSPGAAGHPEAAVSPGAKGSAGGPSSPAAAADMGDGIQTKM